jgi:hypothetical protein
MFRSPREPRPQVRSSSVLHLAIMLVPAWLLLAGTLRPGVAGGSQWFLILGAAVQLLLCSVSFRGRHTSGQALGSSALVLYLTGLAWLGLGRGLIDLDDWYLHFVQALFLIGALLLFARDVLVESGAPDLRRAQNLARRLAERTDWPSDAAACKLLPDVKALREAVQIDPSPALMLLGHPRSEVTLAALGALEFRKHWRPAHAEAVLQVAAHSEEPSVRAEAVTALANVDDPVLVEKLASFLHDPSAEVRRAASEALLWDTARWPLIRLAVRRALGDSAHPEDGPLLPKGQTLTPEAVKDLTGWAAEKGFLGMRSALTLGVHYERALAEATNERLVGQLRVLVADPHAPAALRIELAHLLQKGDMLTHHLQEKLLDPLNPAPLRLLAADALLAEGEHERAATALHDVARLPNREIALATAAVVQKRLGVDLGLPVGQPPPPVQSRQAAEVTRRVMRWATEQGSPQEQQPQASAASLSR